MAKKINATETVVKRSTKIKLEDYRKFFDETPVALFRTDLKTGEFLMANKYCAKLLGYRNVAELKKNEKAANLYSKKERQKLITTIRRKSSIYDYELKLNLHDESIIWVSCYMRINCDGYCIEGSLVDITDKKQLEIELLEIKNKQLNQVSQGIDKILAENYAL